MQLIGNNNVSIGTNIEKVDRIYNGSSTGDVCQTGDSVSVVFDSMRSAGTR